ncbi:bone marrow proteoglycan-like [Mantella aurantiaca]
MYRLLLLLLVGTNYAQEPEDWSQKDSNEISEPKGQVNDCDKPDTLETSPLSAHQLKPCHNVTNEVNNVFSEICPDKSTCHYQVVNFPINFFQAKHSCKSRRGNLSSIHNVCANDQIRCVGKRTCANQQYVWIGVSKFVNSCVYRNVDGSALNYSRFACGQCRTVGTWCVAMNLSSGLWYTFNCLTKLPFVCTV